MAWKHGSSAEPCCLGHPQQAWWFESDTCTDNNNVTRRARPKHCEAQLVEIPTPLSPPSHPQRKAHAGSGGSIRLWERTGRGRADGAGPGQRPPAPAAAEPCTRPAPPAAPPHSPPPPPPHSPGRLPCWLHACAWACPAPSHAAAASLTGHRLRPAAWTTAMRPSMPMQVLPEAC